MRVHVLRGGTGVRQLQPLSQEGPCPEDSPGTGTCGTALTYNAVVVGPLQFMEPGQEVRVGTLSAWMKENV